MINNFMFRMPVRIVFGSGTIANLGQECSVLGTDKILFVTDNIIRKSSAFQTAMDSLNKAGITPAVFSEVMPEPDLGSFAPGLLTLRQSDSQALIALGGGSVMDTAKAIAVLATNPGPVTAYEGLDKFSKPALPIITIPTTAGTGSELSPFSVMNHKEEKRKFVWGGSSLFAKVAIVDPTVLLKMPKAVAAATGMDAFTHALESYLSRRASPLSELFALSGLTRIAGNLRRFVANTEDLDAASNQFLGSLEAVSGALNSGLGVVHAMAHVLGSRFHLSHGLSCAVLLPGCMAALNGSAVEKFATVQELLSPGDKYIDKEMRAKQLPKTIGRMLDDLGLQTNFKTLGATRKDIEEMVGGILKDPRQAHANSPKVLTNEEMAQTYESILL